MWPGQVGAGISALSSVVLGIAVMACPYWWCHNTGAPWHRGGTTQALFLKGRARADSPRADFGCQKG